MVGEHWTPTMVEDLLAEAASVLDRLPDLAGTAKFGRGSARHQQPDAEPKDRTKKNTETML